VAASDSRLRTARPTAIVAGLLGFVLAILTPVLPVQQVRRVFRRWRRLSTAGVHSHCRGLQQDTQTEEPNLAGRR